MCYRRAARIENSVVTSPALGRGSFAEMHVDHAADAQFVKSSRIRGAATAMLTYAIARGSYLRAHDGIVVW